jgi:hypothetical protein
MRKKIIFKEEDFRIGHGRFFLIFCLSSSAVERIIKRGVK